MHCTNTSMTRTEFQSVSPLRWAVGSVFMWGLALGMCGQETDFSPYARFGLGTHQGLLSPGLASTVGLVSVTPDNVFLHADQPASAAGLANPTFQVSAHSQRMSLSEGQRTSNAWTGGPGNMGLVVKKPRANSALSLGLTPLTSKAFSVQRVAEDSLVGNLLERYEGTGGVARAHAGLSHGWRGKTWYQAGTDSVLVSHRGLDLGAQVDHWFGDARQISTLDLEDVSFRDVQTVTSFRHRAAGWILGAQGFQVLRAKYDENKQFKGSWVIRFGGTYSPARTLNTDYERLVQSTLPLGGVTTGIDTSSFEQSERSGTVPQKWTLGGGIQRDGARGNRFGLFVDVHGQDWSEANATLGHLMDGAGSWGDAWSRSLAVVWTPARKPGKVNRPTYRMGVNSSTLPLRISTPFETSSVALEEWRVSAGVNKPLAGSRSASQLHFGMDFGRRYTELETLHTETNLRIHVGVTLTPFVKNLWLTPRLYD